MAHMIMELDKVFTRQGDARAWHGLDTQLDNLDTADASAVGFDYSATTEELQRPSGARTGIYGVYVDGNPDTLQTLQNPLPLVQPAAQLKFVQALSSLLGGKVSSVLTMSNRTRTMLTIELPDHGMRLAKGETLDRYLAVGNAYDGSHPLCATAWDKRAVCNNTSPSANAMNAGEGSNVLFSRKASNKAEFDPISAAEMTAAKFNAIVESHRGRQEQVINTLIETEFSDGANRTRFCNLIAGGFLVDRILEETDVKRGLLDRCIDATINMDLFKKVDATKPVNRRAAQLLWATTDGVGQDLPGTKGTAYGALQGLTYELSHGDDNGASQLFGKGTKEVHDAMLLLSAIANTRA